MQHQLEPDVAPSTDNVNVVFSPWSVKMSVSGMLEARKRFHRSFKITSKILESNQFRGVVGSHELDAGII